MAASIIQITDYLIEIPTTDKPDMLIENLGFTSTYRRLLRRRICKYIREKIHLYNNKHDLDYSILIKRVKKGQLGNYNDSDLVAIAKNILGNKKPFNVANVMGE